MSTVIYVDNKRYDEYKDDDEWRSWKSGNILLYPGSHVIEIEHNPVPYYQYNETRIRNVCVSDLGNWYDITVTKPGQVAVTLVEAIGDKTLQDVSMLKINGPINDSDWETIRRLTGLLALDLSDTDITAIPDEACKGLTSLHEMTLPKTLVTIGKNAFRSTKIHEIVIPASVESIGDYAFAYYQLSKLTKVTFEENSKLKTIGMGAFYNSWIEEFIMPDSVTEIYDAYMGHGDGAFKNCSLLKNVKLSNSLTYIPRQTFYDSGIKSIDIPEGVKEIKEYAFDCPMLESISLPTTLISIGDKAFSRTKLENLVLPEALTTIGAEAFYESTLKSVNLPESVTSIGDNAFYNTQIESIVIPQKVSSLGSGVFSGCSQLKEVTLKSQACKLNSTFSGCEALNTVIAQVASPLAVASDPFPNIDKNSVTVIVPEFALSSFKADSYWFQFKNLKSSADISTADYWAINGHLRLYSGATLSGNPSIEVAGSGVLEIVADTPVALNDFTYNVQEDSPACFLNESNQVTANSLVSKFVVPQSGKWYFFSPVTDVQMANVSYPATDSWVIRYYDGARRATANSSTGNWVNMPADGTLKRGQGYIFQAATPGVLILPAAATELTAFFGVDEAPMTLDDNSCATTENAGWNLVGNPYPAYYDIYSMSLEAPITVWDGSTYRAYSLSDDELVLRPMQPFFVQKTADVTAFAMPRSGRQGSTEIYHPSAQRVKAANADRHRINLEIIRGENESADDYTRIVINEAASLAYEGRYDASKFMSMDTQVAQIYSIGGNSHTLAINERPYADGNANLGVYLPAAGETYRIAAVRADRKAWLFDAETGFEHDLTTGDYTFVASKEGTDNNRFSIRFAPGGTTGADAVSADAVKVAGNNGILSVNAPAGADIAVYAADGSVIAVAKVENGKTEIPVAAGVYVVNVNGQSFKTIVK